MIRAIVMSAALVLVTDVSQGANACEDAGQVASIGGEVTIHRVGEPKPRNAAVEERLCAGDSVAVGGSGRTPLKLVNNAVLRLDQNTSLRLAEVAVSNGAGEVKATAGQSVYAEKGKVPVLPTVVRPRDAANGSLFYPPVLSSLSNAEVPTPISRWYALHRVLQRNPQDGLVYAQRAVIAVAQNRRQQALAEHQTARAIEIFERTVQMASADPMAHFGQRRTDVPRAPARHLSFV